MGHQSGLIVATFLVSHIAAVLNAVGLGGPAWMSATNSNGTVVTQGLWYICGTQLNCMTWVEYEIEVTAWLSVVQTMYTIGCSTCFMAMVLFYLLLLLETKGRKSHRYLMAIAVMFTLSSALLMLAIITYAAKVAIYEAEEYNNSGLDWVFYTAILGDLATFASTLLMIRECTHIRKRIQQDSDSYESIN